MSPNNMSPNNWMDGLFGQGTRPPLDAEPPKPSSMYAANGTWKGEPLVSISRYVSKPKINHKTKRIPGMLSGATRRLFGE